MIKKITNKFKNAKKSKHSKKSKGSQGSKDPYADREARLYENPVPSRELILETITAFGKPCSFSRVNKLLKVKGKQEVAIERRLKAMVRDGQLEQDKRGNFLAISSAELIEGKVIGHADGFGFFQHNEGGRDYFIPPRQMRSLLHGDTAIMRKSGENSRGRMEVVLFKILERANTSVIGRVHMANKAAFIIPENKSLHQDILVEFDDLNGAEDGHIVIAEITQQPNRHHQPMGYVKTIVGEKMAPGMEVHVAVHAHGVPHEWSKGVESDIGSIPAEVTEADRAGRVDYRDMPLVTIDGADSKDFDDAVFCEPKDNGWRLVVAIADVSHYVQVDSEFDKDAQLRGTSVYFANQVIPMLPEALSNGICSLNPKTDRLCMVADMHLDADGELTHYEFHQGVMHSHARLTYHKVAQLLGMVGATDEEITDLSTEFADVLPSVHHLNNLYELRRKKRAARGAIDFETVETKILFNEAHGIEKIVPYERNDAHKIIEEFMILANVTAAKYLSKHKMPALYRVHADPPEEKLNDLRQFLKEISIDFPALDPKSSDYRKVMAAIEDRPDKNVIQTILLRSMSQAVYQTENEGHFGLALEHYAHFTSPIRRYPDLLVHRAIAHLIDKGKASNYAYSQEQVAEIGQHCCIAERRADDATRDAESWLKCEYMSDKVGGVFKGVVSGVTNFGLFIELNDIYVEGLLHISSLKKDYYKHDPVHHCLKGERGGKTYSLGQEIEILVAAVNIDERKIDFVLSDEQLSKDE